MTIWRESSKVLKNIEGLVEAGQPIPRAAVHSLAESVVEEAEPGPTEPTPAKPEAPQIVVNAVMITSHGRRAVVGKDILEVGASIAGGVVEEIEPWGIVVRRDEIDWKLELAPRKSRNDR